MYQCLGNDWLNPKFVYSTVNHPESLMVGGCFTFFKVGELWVLPLKEITNQYHYLELFSDYLSSCFDECTGQMFQHDGTPCHTAKSVKHWLWDFICYWPGNLPNLRPTENLWPIIKHHLQGKVTTTFMMLESAIKEK